ncbi:SAM-dependent methyltransferase [Haloechinothrix sp. LS1_15]|uniref:TRM11 family SAM-dependent methyltransferase n=1 Tax=Haloechinothrix sp. LS1_15 TaxID=2652248 RepID=UPI002944C596|nr:SAM-dependent methyltransferase [Haloechinothrix sp. LS1_15]MDV6012140.1 SAM-dependent methyltransferase [Haloechinothrix sp. LS1_15]
MTRYAILLLPAANRVYADASPALLRAELAAFSERALDGEIDGIDQTRIAGVDYVTFTAQEPLSERDIALLSNLSSVYALFELTGPDTAGNADSAGEAAPLLRPVSLAPLDRFDSDLLTIQKYSGKTNEMFTKLLLNMACLGMHRPAAMLSKRLALLDPLCGRGTTLNQAMMYGFDAVGGEADGKDFEQYERFIKTWLKDKRIKHTADSGQLRKDKRRLGRRLDITYAATKDAYKAGDVQQLSFRNVDTLVLDELYPARSFDLVVADAPYGVQHSSRRHTPDEATSLSRSPRELLTAAVPVWERLLRPGGAMAISWNTYTLPREELTGLLSRSGLAVHDRPPFDGFRHRVDHAIVRDLVVASKPPK